MKKEKSKSKVIPYIDYECKIGERVCWTNIKNEYYEGVITEWLDDSVAVVKLDNKSVIEVKC